VNNQRIARDIKNHLLKLSHNNETLAKARAKELLARVNGNPRVLSRLTKLQSTSYEQLLHITDKLLKLAK